MLKKETKSVMLVHPSPHYRCFPDPLTFQMCDSNQLLPRPDNFKSLTRHFPFFATLLFQIKFPLSKNPDSKISRPYALINNYWKTDISWQGISTKTSAGLKTTPDPPLFPLPHFSHSLSRSFTTDWLSSIAPPICHPATHLHNLYRLQLHAE